MEVPSDVSRRVLIPLKSKCIKHCHILIELCFSLTQVRFVCHCSLRWIENGEQSVAFRVASWRDQRAAQGDLKIAMESDSNFMAFISNKAIANRKKFAKQLRDAASVTDFDNLQFLQAIHSILSQMHSPCLRLELLQYILGLDNRYSVEHVKRSVELAATCLTISESEVFNENENSEANVKLLTS